jgi:hypothetical protein
MGMKETNQAPKDDQLNSDDGMDELNMLEGELLDSDGFDANDENKKRDKEYSGKVDPYDRQIAGFLAMGGSWLGSFVAGRRKKDLWNLSEEEAELFGVSTAKMIEYCFPDLKTSPLIEFVAVTTMLVAARAGADKMSEREESAGQNVEG